MLPSRVTDRPLAPPPIDKRPFAEALRVIELFRQIEAGRDIKQGPWIEFRLAHGEYDEIERMLKQDDDLWGFVDDKIR
jgi:hypothetical protein